MNNKDQLEAFLKYMNDIVGKPEGSVERPAYARATSYTPITTQDVVDLIEQYRDRGAQEQAARNYKPNLSLVDEAYASIGRKGIGPGPNQIDQEGYNFWTNKLKGGMSEEDFKTQFQNEVNRIAEQGRNVDVPTQAAPAIPTNPNATGNNNSWRANYLGAKLLDERTPTSGVNDPMRPVRSKMLQRYMERR